MAACEAPAGMRRAVSPAISLSVERDEEKGSPVPHFRYSLRPAFFYTPPPHLLGFLAAARGGGQRRRRPATEEALDLIYPFVSLQLLPGGGGASGETTTCGVAACATPRPVVKPCSAVRSNDDDDQAARVELPGGRAGEHRFRSVGKSPNLEDRPL
jgi:hypothetical protein